MLWPAVLAIALLGGPGGATCEIAGSQAVVHDVEVSTPSGGLVFDVRELDVVAEPTRVAGEVVLRSEDTIVFTGVARGVTFRPKALTELDGVVTHLGPQAQLFSSRARGDSLRGPVRIGYDATVRDVTVPCRALVLDRGDRRPSTLPVQQRAYASLSWRATDSDYVLRAASGGRRGRFSGRVDLVSFDVLGRGRSRARVVAHWTDGSRIEATMRREQLRLSPASEHALSGGLLYALAGERCNDIGIGRRGGPTLETRAAILPSDTALLDAAGHEWGRTGVELRVTIEHDSTKPLARLVELPGIAAPGQCTESGVAFVRAEDTVPVQMD